MSDLPHLKLPGFATDHSNNPTSSNTAPHTLTPSFSPAPTRQITASDDDVYNQIEIEDMTFDVTLQLYTYPCPCGDRFEIILDNLRDGQQIAVYPSDPSYLEVRSPLRAGGSPDGVQEASRANHQRLTDDTAVTA